MSADLSIGTDSFDLSSNTLAASRKYQCCILSSFYHIPEPENRFLSRRFHEIIFYLLSRMGTVYVCSGEFSSIYLCCRSLNHWGALSNQAPFAARPSYPPGERRRAYSIEYISKYLRWPRSTNDKESRVVHVVMY